MARTRQRAKQRQAKRREEELKAQGTTGQKPPSNPAERAVVDQAEAYEVGDVLEEAGGDADEAAERLDAEPSDEVITPVEAPEAPEPVEAPPARSAPKTRDRTPRKERPAEDGGDGRGGRRGRGGGRGDDGGRRGGRGGGAGQARQREARQRGRVVNFLIQVWAELRRVQWPDRNQITQATSVVVVFCILAGLYLALFDWLFAKLVKAIL